MYTKVIAHHGIKGQKWGIRRYQDENGNYTKAGEARLKKDANALREGSKVLESASRMGSGNKSKTINKNKESYSKLSDDELKKRVNRLNLEDQYSRLIGDQKRVRSGSDWVREVLQSSAIVMGMAASAASIYIALKNRQ